MRFAVLTVFLLGCGGGGFGLSDQQSLFASSRNAVQPRHAAVAALPVFARVGRSRTPMVLRGHISRRERATIARVVRRTRRDFLARLPELSQVDQRPVDVCIFRRNRDYRRFIRAFDGAPSQFRGGFYMPDRRVVAVNLTHGRGNLRHEIIHPLLKDAYPAVPPWLDEGLASLYERATFRNGTYRFRAGYGLYRLRRALWRNRLPSFQKLATSSWADVHGAHEKTYYATGRYLLLYMHRRGRLRAFLRDVFANEATPREQLRALRRHASFRSFKRWLD